MNLFCILNIMVNRQFNKIVNQCASGRNLVLWRHFRCYEKSIEILTCNLGSIYTQKFSRCVSRSTAGITPAVRLETLKFPCEKKNLSVSRRTTGEIPTVQLVSALDVAQDAQQESLPLCVLRRLNCFYTGIF